jgi:hypothetical protein
MKNMFFTKKQKLDAATLHALFNQQKQTLIQKGYPALLGMSEEEFNAQTDSLWKLVSEKLGSLEIIVKGKIPLLLVVSQGLVIEKMAKINAHTELDVANVNLPKENPLYVLLDVEDGEHMVAKSPKDALKKFEKDNRSALTINESIALLTHYPELLKNHYLISAGSFYPKGNETLPLLWLLDEHGNPELHYAWFHIAHGSYGTASYSTKI